MGRRLLRLFRAACALVVLAAIGSQAMVLAAEGRLNPVNFLSYFTIQSNVIGAAVFAAGAVRAGNAPSHRWDLVRGAAVVYLTVTFVVFSLLLADTNVDTALSWVNTVVHFAFPLAVIVDWLLDPPATRIGGGEMLAWLAYPVAWIAWTMVRGPIAGWYPYPFLDPANGGYGAAAGYIVGIIAFGLVVMSVVRAVGNVRRGWPRATATRSPAG